MRSVGRMLDEIRKCRPGIDNLTIYVSRQGVLDFGAFLLKMNESFEASTPYLPPKKQAPRLTGYKFEGIPLLPHDSVVHGDFVISTGDFPEEYCNPDQSK